MSLLIFNTVLRIVVWARACLLRHVACPAAGLGLGNAFNPAQAQDAAQMASMSRMFVGVQPLKSEFRGLARNARPSGPISVVRDSPSSCSPLLSSASAACYLTVCFLNSSALTRAFGIVSSHGIKGVSCVAQLLVLIALVSAAFAAIRARIVSNVRSCSACHGYGISR